MASQYNLDSLLSTIDVAIVLNKSVRTVIRWRKQGKGPTPLAINSEFNANPTYVYRYRDVLAWLEKQPRGGQPLQYSHKHPGGRTAPATRGR